VNKLFFELSPRDHPYPEEKNSEFELWGEIRLILSNGVDLIKLINHQWDIIEIYSWFIENKKALLTDLFPFDDQNNKSIAECRSILYARENFENEVSEEIYYEELENYFSRHTFKLRGTDIPLFHIGIKNGEGEISWQNIETKKFHFFLFDMGNFINSTQKEFDEILKSFYENNNNRKLVLERIGQIERKSQDS
jgi:hypothetical protein